MIETYENEEHGLELEISQNHRGLNDQVYFNLSGQNDFGDEEVVEIYLPVQVYRSMLKTMLRADEQLELTEATTD